MKIASITITLLVILALPLMLSSALAGDSEHNRKTLAGIDGVAVVVNDLNDALMRAGLTIRTLQTDVELRLRSVGIPIKTEKHGAWLVLNMSGFSSETKEADFIGYTSNASLEVHQWVRLMRNPSIETFVPTWFVNVVSNWNATAEIRELIRDRVDEFANAYLSVNQSGCTPGRVKVQVSPS